MACSIHLYISGTNCIHFKGFVNTAGLILGNISGEYLHDSSVLLALIGSC